MSVAVNPGKLGVYLSAEDPSLTPQTAAVARGEPSWQPVAPPMLAAKQGETDFTGLALGGAALLVIYLIIMKG